MRKSCSLKYHAVGFLLEYLFPLALISLTLGSFDTVSEAKCEYEDANLIWRNTPAYSLHDVKAMAWYKGKGSLIATWLEGKGFVEYAPYIGRLMQIGETGIKIRTSNRSDTGDYWLSLTLASVDHKLEAATHLEVIVAPSNKCKPKIIDEGSVLKADLPSEGCGTPRLTPKWKHTNMTVIQELHNSSLLDLGRNSEPREYMVCAEGDSAKCYQGNISDLCTRHTTSLESQHRRRDDGSTPDRISIILPTVLVAMVAALVSTVLVIWLKRKRKLCCRNTADYRPSEEVCLTMEGKPIDIDEACPHNEKYPLVEKDEASRTGSLEIENHLRSLYKSMTSVPVSPTGKENFVDVSEVYIDLDFQQMETREIKYTETDLSWTQSYNSLVSKEDIHIAKARSHKCSPIMIVGCSGSGKSTWCKHLVQCWSRHSKIKDANVQGLNLPDLGKFKILLYLPLKSSDRGLSFQELLKQYLFQEQPTYLNIIMKYIYDECHAQSILLLIDGLDKIGESVKPISELLDHKLMSPCTILFTCRPSSFTPIFNACIDSSIQHGIFKVCEIPLEKSTAYVCKVWRAINQHNKDCNITNFLTFAKYLHVQSLLKLPYLCLTLLFVWMENKHPDIEITDILLRIVEHLLDCAKTDQNCTEKLGNYCKETRLMSTQVLTN